MLCYSKLNDFAGQRGVDEGDGEGAPAQADTVNACDMREERKERLLKQCNGSSFM